MQGSDKSREQLVRELEAAKVRVGQLERDLSRAQAERGELEQTRQRFEQVTRWIREVFWLRTEREILYISPAYEEIWGRSRESLQRDPDAFVEAIHPEDRPMMRERLAACFTTGAVNPEGLEYRILRPDGSLRWIRSRNFVVSEVDRPVHVAGIAEDVTQRREVEEAYRVLVDQSMQGLAIAQDRRVVFANHALVEITGYSLEQLFSLSAEGLLDLIHPDSRAKVAATWRDLAEGKAVPERYEVRAWRADGRVLWVEISTCPVEYRGRPATQAAFIDITERKAADEQRLALERKIQQMHKLESLGLLAGGVAHELNQPVQTIQGFAQRILRRGERTVAEVADELKMIEGATHRMERIIQNMRLFARSEELQLSPIDPVTPLEDALELLRHDLETLEIDLVWGERAASISPVLGDRVQLQQVYLNLLLNARDAIKAAPPERERRILLSAQESEGHVVCSVQDTGPGLAPAQETHLFEPFYTTKVVGHGTGLGLSISYGIVQDHGGQLSYHSPPEGGAVFSVALPVHT